jgi:hypothetical protein
LSAQVSISITSEKDSFEIGESIPLELSFRFEDLPVDIKMIRFSVLDSLGIMNYLFPEDSLFMNAPEVDFDIADYGHWVDNQKKEFSGKDLRWPVPDQKGVFKNNLEIIIWNSGEFRVMVTELQYEDKTGKSLQYFPKTNEAKIVFIKGSSGGEQSTRLAPIDPIIKRSFPGLYFRVFLLTFAVIVLILTLIDRFKKRTKKEIHWQFPSKPEKPAHEIAFIKLEKLSSSAYHLNGEIKMFYSELSLILRTYLEDRYRIPALENTTDEILFALQPRVLAESTRNRLQEILSVADLVKFAKGEPTVEVHLSMLQKAKEFVELTKFIPVINNSDK